VRVACFVTAHGMGHATRACAVMQALRHLSPVIEFDIFTSLPPWIFEFSLDAPFRLHPLGADIGLVQRTPYEEDLPATLHQLSRMLPYPTDRVSQVAQVVRMAGCRLVLCDISPLGILVAEQAGIPSVLVENFRWDWIYAGYIAAYPEFQVYVDDLAVIYERVSVHIQTEPLCDPVAQVALVAPPISRAVRTPAQELRLQLGMPEGKYMLLVTSSTPLDPGVFAAWESALPDLFFVFPADVPELQPTPNGMRVPRSFYHPDLVNASAGVIGKAGYSTLAEAYYAGALFAYVGRKRFRESAVLGAYIQNEMGGFEIPDEWQALSWLRTLSEALKRYIPEMRGENGSLKVARFILNNI
jgi:hypothetical protein